MLNGPSSPPACAVTVPAGDDSDFEASFNLDPNTTYWFAPGVHTLGSGEFSQIQPREGDTFIGAPGAILSGQGQNDSAFAMDAPNVTIEYLTIQDFTPPGSQGAVNHDSGRGWTISHNTIQNNSPGAALILGSDNTATFNCLTRNGEYGFNAEGDGDGHSTLTGGPDNITLSNNEISFNDTCNFDAWSPNPVPASMRPSNCGGAGEGDGCGCSGAGKFWEVDNATVNSNYVHDNFNVGLWADTNDNGFTFKGNYIKDNWSIGLQYELSYNADIEDNTFIGNAIGAGPTNPGFPEGAIYLSEARRGQPGAQHRGHQHGDRVREHLHQQLVRRGPLGERGPVLRIAGQQLDRHLHAGPAVGGQYQYLRPGPPPGRDRVRVSRLLRPVPLEDAERAGHRQYLQPGRVRGARLQGIG